MQLGFSYRHVSLLAALLVLLVQSTTVVMAQEQVAGEEKGAVEEEMVAEEKVVAEDKAAAPSAVSVAVLNFETKAELEETAEKVGENVSAVLTSLLSGEPQLLLVERAELTKLLSEQSLSISGTVDTESAATIGKLTGADVLITGRMFTAGNQRVLVAKIMGTETSRVFGEMVSASVQQPYVDQVVGLAEKIKATLGAQQSVLTVPQE